MNSSYDLTLKEKEKIFEHDLLDRFILEGQVICKIETPMQMPLKKYNSPDNAYMTGIVLSAYSMKYKLTKDEHSRRIISYLLEGLNTLCNISGRKGLLVRSFIPLNDPTLFTDYKDGEGLDFSKYFISPCQNYILGGNVSSDQMAGVYYGYYHAYEIASNSEKEIIRNNVRNLTDHLIENDFRILDFNDEYAQWGNYTKEYCLNKEKMNALLLLQHLKVTVYITNDSKYEDIYNELVNDGYAMISENARNTYPSIYINHSDDVLIYMALQPLLDLEENQIIKESYLKSATNFWNGAGEYENSGLYDYGTKHKGSPLYDFFAMKYLDINDNLKGKENLKYFPFHSKWNDYTIKKYEYIYNFINKTNPISEATKLPTPLPFDRLGKSWSCLVRSGYNYEVVNDINYYQEYNGHDYLMAYWLGRYFGYIEESE